MPGIPQGAIGSRTREGASTSSTKGTIQAAFSHLVLTENFDGIQIADILGAAGVARSTFYKYFAGKDDVLRSVMSPILDPMARAGSARDTAPVIRVAEHIWSNRRLARSVLMGPARKAIARDLEARIEQTLLQTGAIAQAGFVASVIAQWQLACLEEWLTGRHRCDARSWAATLCRGTAGLTEALADT